MVFYASRGFITIVKKSHRGQRTVKNLVRYQKTDISSRPGDDAADAGANDATLSGAVLILQP